jgi:hypothetical protein
MTMERIRIGFSHGKYRISTRTQNPKVEEGIACALKELARGKEIDVSREKQEGVYGRRLAKDLQKSCNERINKVYAQLDADRGDAFLLKFNVIL